MNTSIILKQGFAYLKDYEFYTLTNTDIRDIQKGYFFNDLRPFRLDKRIFLKLGFQYCLDNFGREFYFKGLGINIWYDQRQLRYYYQNKNCRYHMIYLSGFQDFLYEYIGYEICDFSDIPKYVNELYSMERRLFLMSPKERNAELDNSLVRTINLRRKKQDI